MNSLTKRKELALLNPGRIGRLEIKNRIVMAPMGTTGLTELDGRFSPRAIDYYVARAKGGTGLIITGLMAVDNEIERKSPSPWCYLPRADAPMYIARLTELTEMVHDYGAKIAAQLTAGVGRVARATIANAGHAVAPSAQPCFWSPGVIAKELTSKEIDGLIAAMARSANVVVQSGFDALELHAHEGYLIDQFMTALWNKRTDEYGGDLYRRLTFVTKILEAIKHETGPNFPIIFRMSGRHHVQGGRDLEESIKIALYVEKLGITCLHIDAGCYDAWDWAHPPILRKPTIDDVKAIKKAVMIPVIAVGRLDNPEIAEDIIATGKADFVALGRGLLADPEWVNKVSLNKADDLRPCIGCHDGCLARIFKGKYISCAVNPTTGMEREFILRPTEQKRSILIVGGGPAGMEAARVAASRGHNVTLWEKRDQLGGNLIAAGVPDFKADLRNLSKYLIAQLNKLRVEVELNRDANPDAINAFGADRVILATGSEPVKLDVPGKDNAIVASPADLLLGKRKAGPKVVVLGGGYMGCEVAVWVAMQGKEVVVVEALGELMDNEFLANRRFIRGLMDQYSVKILTDTRVLEVKDNGVSIENSDTQSLIEADTIAFAIGPRPVNALFENMKDNQSCYTIGDCVSPRKVMGAIWDGFRLARLI